MFHHMPSRGGFQQTAWRLPFPLRPKLLPGLVAGIVLGWIAGPLPAYGQETAPEPSLEAGESFFVESVLPLLESHCFECHSHEYQEASGGLMLDSMVAMQAGGTRGAAVVAGDTASWLLRAMRYDDSDLQMPPDGKLPDEAIAVMERWIREGAAMPESMRGQLPAGAAGEAQDPATSHWAYQMPARWTSAEGSTDEPIDQLVLSRLSEQGLAMSPAADRRTLLRRITYDLIGLPPTPDEYQHFESDSRSDAEIIAERVDSLLASEHFGERWARYWMDLARYADNKGYVFQEDREYPGAFQYRDWLIRALNQDMPYDEFVTRQLAADLMVESDAAVASEQTVAVADAPGHLPALGFLTLGRRFLNNRLDIVDDRLDVVSRGLMGMTLACARCHDHKYDPISQADYYAMSGIFMNTEEPGGEPWPHRLKEAADLQPSFILVRGSPGNRGDQVPRRFVSFLSRTGQTYDQGSGRMELAREITSTDNPLTSRVIANRVWMRLLGSSLVESPSDLGTRCPPPEQLALLDHLATSLTDDGWSLKRLIRRIVLTKTYQQQSLYRAEAATVDPENRLYWKANRRRLDFEAYRDTLLARAGLLDQALFGPSASISGRELMKRRTVYAYIDRQNLPSLFRTFDFASPDSHSPQRSLTSVPQQGLFVMNSHFIAQVAEALEQQLEKQLQGSGVPTDDLSAAMAEADSPQAQAIVAAVRELFVRVLARQPTAEELQLGLDFVANSHANEQDVSPERWICGYGAFDPVANQLTTFQRLPYFEPGKWQGGSQLPDERLGWCLLTADGGHVGNDLQHAVVRRWVAPRAGTITVRGKLKHNHAEGDGVRGTILVAGQNQGQWMAHNGEQNTAVKQISVQLGDTVDAVADCREGPNHDSFDWTIRIRYHDGGQEEFMSRRELPEPRSTPLGRWAQFAQCLLSTNELAFVD